MINKFELIEVREEEPDYKMMKVSTIFTKIASERETVKPENIKNKSVARFLTCSILTTFPEKLLSDFEL